MKIKWVNICEAPEAVPDHAKLYISVYCNDIGN